MRTQHKWLSNDVINMCIVIGLLFTVMGIVLISAFLYHTGHPSPEVMWTTVTSITSGLIGYLARDMSNRMPGTGQGPGPTVVGDPGVVNVQAENPMQTQAKSVEPTQRP